MAEGLSVPDLTGLSSVDPHQTACPAASTVGSAVGAIVDAEGYNIVVSDSSTTLTATPNRLLKADGSGTAMTAAELSDAGLASTRSVWMLQPAGMTNTSVPGSCAAPTAGTINHDAVHGASSCHASAWQHHSGSSSTHNLVGGWKAPVPGDLPRVTAVSNTADNEVIIFGGTMPDGTSYCLIKVFDADDRTQIGEYRVARSGSAGGIAVCTEGIDAAGANEARFNAGWPEPR